MYGRSANSQPVRCLVYGDSLNPQVGEYLKSHGSVGVRYDLANEIGAQIGSYAQGKR